MKTRIEKDFLGEKEIKEMALYGIHSIRASENFLSERNMSLEWYKAIGEVKHAIYETYQEYKISLLKKFKESEIPFLLMDDAVIFSLIKSSEEVLNGAHFGDFIVAGDSGGAGTSLNMNVNEIIANRSLQLMGKNCGEYNAIDPIESCNVFQSTNDVIPTALRIAMMRELNKLEDNISYLRIKIEEKEKEGRDKLRIGYTEMQKAVPTSFGKLFSSYQEAFNRDWWRVSKCFERIKEVNIGGSAVGTGLTVPRFFIKKVVERLRQNTKLPIAKSTNYSDTTSNLDSLVEVHSILKILAVNLEKFVSDLRLLSSDFFIGRPLQIPSLQVGSSIMPGKVNPVMAEFVIGKVHQIYAHNQVITSLAGQGVLELSAYISQVGTLILEDLKSLINLTHLVGEKMVLDLKFNFKESEEEVFKTPTVVTALIPLVGYHKAKKLWEKMNERGLSVFEANKEVQIVSDDVLKKLMEPSELLKLGFSLNEFKKINGDKL